MDQVESMAMALTLAGHRVELTLSKHFSPEIIFLDIGMPYLDGYQLLKRLRQHFRAARIYAVTGRADNESRRKTIEAGFDGHLVKPVDFSEVERVLHKG